MIRLILLSSLAMLLCAQSATVYDLTATESADGARLYRAMKDSQDAYNAWAEKIGVKYALIANCISATPCAESLEFDSKFKHAVPKPIPQPQPQNMRPFGAIAW